MSVSNLASAHGKHQSGVVHIRTVVTESTIVERAAKLQSAVLLRAGTGRERGRDGQRPCRGEERSEIDVSERGARLRGVGVVSVWCRCRRRDGDCERATATGTSTAVAVAAAALIVRAGYG